MELMDETIEFMTYVTPSFGTNGDDGRNRTNGVIDMGYKLGKYVNVGYNPSFGPSTTDQYSATGGATMVVGENNFVSGTNNVVFGKENLMYGEASSSIIAGTGNQVSGSSFGMTVLGYLNTAASYFSGWNCYGFRF